MQKIQSKPYTTAIKVGQAERSDFLMANAWYLAIVLQFFYSNFQFYRHHRSDAYSSAVALVAIVGSYAGMPVLDPLGGIAVSAMLVKSSVGLIRTSMSELMDKGITNDEMESIVEAVSKVKVLKKNKLLSIFSNTCENRLQSQV